MPPKGWKKTLNGFQPVNSSNISIKEHKPHSIEDLLLPRTVVTRIAKEALPENTPLPKDGVTAMNRAAVMFISYVTNEANQNARKENRKTIYPIDIQKALEVCQFQHFIAPTLEMSAKMLNKPDSGTEGLTEDFEPAPEDISRSTKKARKQDLAKEGQSSNVDAAGNPDESSNINSEANDPAEVLDSEQGELVETRETADIVPSSEIDRDGSAEFVNNYELDSNSDTAGPDSPGSPKIDSEEPQAPVDEEMEEMEEEEPASNDPDEMQD